MVHRIACWAPVLVRTIQFRCPSSGSAGQQYKKTRIKTTFEQNGRGMGACCAYCSTGAGPRGETKEEENTRVFPKPRRFGNVVALGHAGSAAGYPHNELQHVEHHAHEELGRQHFRKYKALVSREPQSQRVSSCC